MSDLSFIACILFANVNFTHVKKYATLEISPYGAAHAHYWHHSRPQSCDPCGQRNGSVAVARPKDLGTRMVLHETGLVLCRKNDVRLERN